MSIEKLLKCAVDLKASDLHLNAHIQPVARIDGALRILKDEEQLSAAIIQGFFDAITNKKQQEKLQERKQLDFAYVLPEVGRFRVNALIQRDALSLCFRVIPKGITTLDNMGLPDIYAEVTENRKGLILVTGPTGSGKSTTLAAMVNYINETDNRQIITVEDPIEYLHVNKRSIILQLEVGRDTESFSQALWNTLRHDPDVLVVGEMRDLETISAAITAAETGHLVMGTLHTNDATQTIDRIIDVFPHGQQSQIRVQLSQVLLAVCSQLLLPRIGGGRIPACEIMVANSAVRNSIREGKNQYLQNAIQLGLREKMQTMNQALAKLVVERQVTVRDAMQFSNDKEQLTNLVSVKECIQKPVPV